MIVWLTGRVGAGKTTLGKILSERLNAVLLDGGDLRENLSSDLGFSASDRKENARRAMAVAKLLDRQGVDVVVTLVQFPAEPVLLFYLTGSGRPVTGKGDEVDRSVTPKSAIRIDTDGQSVEQSFEQLLNYVMEYSYDHTG